MLERANIPIFGGDVYIVKDEKIHPTSDSWYVTPESMSDNWNRAEEYIRRYETSNHGKNLYVLVF